jgi:hypothetical protein
MTRMNVDAIRGLSQPDQRSCGPSSLVAAHILLDPAYAATQNPHAFATSVLALHRQLTGASAFGHAQLPWPRALGTPPWAVARAMTSFAGVRYRSRVVRWGKRSKAFDSLHTALTAGHPCPMFVGDWIPRHVVLAVAPTDSGVDVYNPAHGTLAEMKRADFEAGKLTTVGSWTRPWFVVLPV